MDAHGDRCICKDCKEQVLGVKWGDDALLGWEGVSIPVVKDTPLFAAYLYTRICGEMSQQRAFYSNTLLDQDTLELIQNSLIGMQEGLVALHAVETSYTELFMLVKKYLDLSAKDKDLTNLFFKIRSKAYQVSREANKMPPVGASRLVSVLDAYQNTAHDEIKAMLRKDIVMDILHRDMIIEQFENQLQASPRKAAKILFTLQNELKNF